VMKWNSRCMATALLALLAQAPAMGQSAMDADVWIGFENGDDGFLLDVDTGSLWMTGSCLKALAPASRQGTVWVSETQEMVSVGRMTTLLEQTFRIDVSDEPSITVENSARGGSQDFRNVVLSRCQSGACRALAVTQVC